MDKLTAKKTTKQNQNDIDCLKNNLKSPKKIINCNPPLQSKNKNLIKNTKSILEKENETSNLQTNKDDIFWNGTAFNLKQTNDYDFKNIKNQKNNNFQAKSDLNKRDLLLGKANYASSLNEKSI